MTDREIVCIYYEYEGKCKKGRKGIFRKTCQTCSKYTPRKGSLPARKNLKKQKTEKIKEHDIKKMMQDY